MRGWLAGVHRDAWRDALRLGVQSGVAGAVAYAVADWAGLDRFLVIMMAVTALGRSVGGTAGQAYVRLESALAGSVLGMVALLLTPAGWGSALAMAVSLAIVGAAMTLRASWQLAVVPVVGMSLAGRENLLDTAGVTAAGILTGAVIGFAASFLVWPERSEARFERHYRRALRATATRLEDAVAATLEDGRAPRVDAHVSEWNEAVWLAGEALGEARFTDPKGMTARLGALRGLHDAVTILDRAAEASDPPLSVEVQRDRVGRLRREVCEVLLGLAGGQAGAEGRIGAMDRDLGRLRAAMGEEDPRAPEHEVHAALAFGLGEVRRSLADLVAAHGGAGAP